MYVKGLEIGGFKSFRHADLGDAEFSPMVNCLIGQNGSGKSNLFAALQFVLGHGQYRTISAEERKELLYEGPGNKVFSAFVELRLDNTEGRLTLDSDAKEMVIRRTLGSKKDEYRVNNLNASASEVHKMLEAAGFSPSNPYNIVQQGKIQAFATMSDAQRFDLLKEIAGTKVYEDRRNTSLGVLADTEKEMGTVKANIQNLDSRLSDLSQEREEYKQFQLYERQHKCLQYSVHRREAEAAQVELKKIEEYLDERDEASKDGAQRLHELQQKLRESEKKGAAAAVTMQQCKRQRELVLQERNGWVKRQARAEVQLHSLTSRSKDQQGLKKKMETVLVGLEKNIKKKEGDVQQLEVKVSAANAKAAGLATERRTLDARVSALITKRGRHNQFSTQKERDVYLKAEIGKAEKTLKGYETELGRLAAKVDDELPDQVAAVEAAMKEKRAALVTAKAQRESKKTEAAALVKNRDALAEKRRELYRQQGKLQQGLDLSGERYGMAESRLNKTMPRDVQQGLKSVREVLASEDIAGVYGPVINLFTVDAELYTACDVVAGNSLFHIVVDTNETASKILKSLNKRKLPGRPSFYPLNRINSKPKQLPTGEDCFPLFDRLKFENQFSSVLADLFGRVLVCTTLGAAGAHSKSQNCDCVLVNGDKVDARGGISGGFLDRKVCRLGVAAELNKIKAERAEQQAKMDDLMQAASEVDQEVVKVRGELTAVEGDGEGALRDRERIMYDLAAAEKDLRQLAEAKTQATKARENQTADITSLQTALVQMQEEIKAPMAQKLSDEEAQELSEKQKELDALTKNHSHEAAGAEALRAELQAARQTLSENLLKQQTQLKQKLEEIDVAVVSDGKDGQAAREVQLVKQRMEALGKEVSEMEKQIEAAANERAKASEEGEAVRRKMAAFQKDLGKDRVELDERRRSRVTLLNRIDEAEADLRKLGAVPAGAEEYQSTGARELAKLLEETRKKLKKFQYVNKKSYDQFSELSDAKDALEKSFEERMVEKKAVEKLIADLDAKKDEAVLRTFKQLKAQFATNFRDLCGHDGAAGEVILHRAKTGAAKKVEEFTGVGVKVNFGVGGGVGGGGSIDLTRLSGGQKSLVALAMIFAIQLCDPAPFYVFDEIDAALDAEYRSNVARKIQDLSKQAQFLMVSFKREMVDTANKHFAITFKNKVSRLQACTAEEAQALLLTHGKEQPAARKRARNEMEDVAEQPTQELG